MKEKTLILLVLFALLITPSLVLAQEDSQNQVENTTPNTNPSISPATGQNYPPRPPKEKIMMRPPQGSTGQGMKEYGTARPPIGGMREGMPERQGEEDIQEKVQTQREDMQEKFKTERLAFQQKIQTIKDERKKAIIEKVDSSFTTVNTNATNVWAKALEKLSTILSYLQTKVTTAKATGQDTAAADAAIATAQTAITDATTAVTAQAGKSYIPQISTDATLKQNVGSTLSTIQSDMRATYKAVFAARLSVMNAAKEVMKLSQTKTVISPTTEPSVTTETVQQ